MGEPANRSRRDRSAPAISPPRSTRRPIDDPEVAALMAALRARAGILKSGVPIAALAGGPPSRPTR